MAKLAYNTQEAFEKALKEDAETYGLTLHIDYRFANTGIYRIVPPNSFKSVQKIDFSWAQDSAQGGVYVDGLLDPPFEESPTTRFYFRADELDQFLKALRGRFARARAELNKGR